MKFIIIRYLALMMLLVSGLFPFYTSAEEKDSVKAKADPSLEFSYLKNSDGSKSLICNIGISINRRVIPVKFVSLNFFTGNDHSISLGSAVTNYKGNAICKIPTKYALPTNEEGKISFKVEYPGNDTLETTSEELQIIDVTMEMTCNDADSIKTVTVKMYKNDKDKIIPLKDETVNFYIPRMFSLLKIGEGKLDSTGKATLDFPVDLPGDSIGNLTILARLEEHSDFGNIEKSETRKWGIPTTKERLLEQRALWSQVAPVWMIITLTIMLVGVWAHYLYVVIHMIIINNKGKDQKIKTGTI
jgi:hypothetical protein